MIWVVLLPFTRTDEGINLGVGERSTAKCGDFRPDGEREEEHSSLLGPILEV